MEVHKKNKEIPFHHSISSYSSPPQSSLAQGEKSPTLDPSHKLNNNNNSSHPQDPSPSPSLSPGPSSSSSPRKEVMVRYRECQRNHAAHLGSHVVDGCGEFMPSGEEGTHLALKCAACECHRNFHRREVEGETTTTTTTATTAANLALMQQATPASLPAANCYISFSKYHKNNNNSNGNNLVPIRPNNDNFTITPPPPIPPAAAAMQQQQNHHRRSRAPVMMAFGGGGAAAESSSEDLNAYRTGDFDYGGHQYGVSKKRHRTKFSQEQKDKMLEFAEKVGWRMQKQDDVELQRFCHDVGVKRQVFKVWMHNNKQAIKKKQP